MATPADHIAISPIIYRLQASPMFHLCLSDKELFHSNFIKWLIGLEHPDGSRWGLTTFNRFLASVGLPPLPADCRALREKNNFDIAFVTDHPTKAGCPVYHLIVENKVKSLPSPDQLRAYNAKMGLTPADGSVASDKKGKKAKKASGDFSHTSRLLLTLILPDGPTLEGWTVASFRDFWRLLADAPGLADLDPYHSRIIRDYCAFNSAIVSICNALDARPAFVIEPKVI